MTTLNLQVAASADDAYESGGTVTLTDDTRAMTGTGRTIGMRFLNLTIAVGSTINSAVLQLYCHSTSYDDPHFSITGEDIDDAPTFTTGGYNISARTDTTASVAWDATGVGGGWESTPSLVSILQEIVDRVGWASGNDVVLMQLGTTGVNFEQHYYDYAGNVTGAKLDVDYTAPSAGQPMQLRGWAVPGMRKWVGGRL